MALFLYERRFPPPPTPVWLPKIVELLMRTSDVPTEETPVELLSIPAGLVTMTWAPPCAEMPPPRLCDTLLPLTVRKTPAVAPFAVIPCAPNSTAVLLMTATVVAPATAG